MTVPLSWIGAAARLVPGTSAQRLLILIYHRVLPLPDEMFPFDVHAAAFDRQMGAVRQHCNPLSLVDALAALKERRLPARAVAVTFDDGYADNESVALPILLKHAVPASFFVATGFLDGGRMWNDTVIEAIRGASTATIDLRGCGLDRYCVATAADKGATAKAILRSIKHRPADARAEAARAVADSVKHTLPDDLMMTRSQVRNLSSSGMEVGCHTHTHPILNTLSNDDIRSDILRNREELERIVGRPIGGFAYPNGVPGEDFRRTHRDLVQSLGFEYALSTRRGAVCTASDRFELPRFTPWDAATGRWLARLLLEYRNLS